MTDFEAPEAGVVDLAGTDTDGYDSDGYDIDQDISGHRNRVAGRDYHQLTNYTQNVFVGVGSIPVPPTGTCGTLLDRATVRWHLETFVPPTGFTSALDKLRGPDRAVFVADQDTGITLRGLGIALLKEVSGHSEPPIDLIEADPDLDLSTRPVTDNALVLLDLTALESSKQVDGQFGAFLRRVVDAAGRMVVLLPGPANGVLTDRYGHLVAEITAAPPAAELLRTHLKASGVDDVTINAVLADRDVTSICAHARPADAVRLARLFCLITPDPTTDPDSDSARRLAEAVAAYHNWSDELAREFDQNPDPRRRALLLATALLNGGRLEHVHRAEAALLRITGAPDTGPQGLASESFRARLADLPGVEISDDRVRFTRSAYDFSVLHHVWQSYPQLRAALVDWLVAVPLDTRIRLDRWEVPMLADRVVELCARNDMAAPIVQAVRRWSSAPQAGTRELSATVLGWAATRDPIGRRIRSQIYQWARKPQLPEPIVHTIVAVCRQEFGRTHSTALTALGWLAGHEEPWVADLVADTVLGLAAHPGGPEAVLTRVAEWVAGGRPSQWQLGVRVLIELTVTENGPLTPADLVSHKPIRDLLVRSWDVILDGADHGKRDWAVRAWLVAAKEARWGEALLDVLVEAAGERARPLDFLRLTASRWHRDIAVPHWPAAGEADERAVVDALDERIDRVHPLALRAFPAEEGTPR